jgi:hypothetical protein
MIIYVDIDKTICYIPKNRLNNNQKLIDYRDSIPIKKNIEKINKLFNIGHTVIYWTARGSLTGLNWENITYRQFKKWGVKYTSIKFQKPYYDMLIDDKAFKIEEVEEYIQCYS